jgi:hypothetical protein
MRRLGMSVALLSALALAATACANNTTDKGTKNNGTGGFGSSVGPSTGASGSASPSGQASPSTGGGHPSSSPSTGGGLGPVTHSAIANKSGFVWVSTIAANSTPTDAYHYNSTGGAVTVTHASTGRYSVTFAGLGTSGGVAHAQAYGANANFCNVVSWNAVGPDEHLDVACYTSGTAPVDTYFVANFAVGHQGTARFSYLWNDQPSLGGQHVPSTTYRYDSTGRDPWIQRVSTGDWKVYLPASYDEQNEPYTFQVTAYGAATFRCNLVTAFVGAGIHEVQCRDAVGTPYDTKFALSFSAEGSIIGRTDNRFGDYNEHSPGIDNSTTGVYTVPADGLGAPRGQVVVDARGNTSNYCHVGNWGASGTVLKMVVRCFAPGGAPANTAFTLGVTW